MSNTAPPDFGTAWSCLTDLTMPAVLVSGFRVVAEAVVRRWSTPRGTLIDDPNYGYDLTDAIGDDLDDAGLTQWAQGAAAEARKDQRVLSASVTITLVDGVMIVKGLLKTAQGPFSLVVAVSNVSVSLLKVTP